MHKRRILALLAVLALVMTLTGITPCAPASAQESYLGDVPWKPYRVLVVTGTQMRDDYVIHNAWDFGDVTALLKMWGVPFDVLRLDSQTMALSDFIDGEGYARYGTILWTARQDQYPWQPQDYSILAQAVNDYHISLVALANKIQEPVIQGLLGLTYDSWGTISDPLTVGGASHFISRDLSGTTVPASEAFPGGGPRVTVSGGDVDTLATAGALPQLTARTVDADSRTRAVWIGGHPDQVFATSPTFIQFLQRSLVWAMGYGVYKDYDNTIVLRIDDPGGAQTAYLGSWHYPQLSQTIIQDYVIAPLEAHDANMGVGFNPGYPWIPTHSITHSVYLDFIDPHGTRQNIVSTYAGVLDGIAADVLEAQSHGLTHMVPDLDTPIPGSTNWWDGSIGGEWDVTGWYREFYDTRRGAEVDAAMQLSRLTQSADWIEEDFGARPLIFIPGGHAISGDRYVGGSGAGGTITVTLQGATPGTAYTTYYGNEGTTWANIGTLTTDSNGDGQGVFGYPSSIFGTTDRYFTVNRGTEGTQFIAGPTVDPLGYDFDLTLRDYTEMTAAEQTQFYLADEELDSGSVAGSGTYTPPHIADNYTYKLAGEAGYGLGIDTTSHYLGSDYVVTLRACTTSYAGSTGGLQDDFNRGLPAVCYLHDRDIANNNNYLVGWLNTIDATWSNVDYLSQNEWVGYMHAQLGATAPTTDSVQFDFSYDSHYCPYFSDHTSTWTLHLTDELLGDLQALGQIDVVVDSVVVDTVDAATHFAELQTLEVPAGTGAHAILFQPAGLHGEPVSIEVAPDMAEIFAGESQAFSATAEDDQGRTWDVTVETTFDIDDEAGGLWASNVYTGEVAGTWTITGTFGALTDTVLFKVKHGPSVAVELVPDPATITAGDSISYTLLAMDVYSNTWDVNHSSTFDIDDGAGGSWLDNVYTSEVAGTWTVSGDYLLLSDTAVLTVEHGTAVDLAPPPATTSPTPPPPATTRATAGMSPPAPASTSTPAPGAPG